jgi:hypothetical protein
MNRLPQRMTLSGLTWCTVRTWWCRSMAGWWGRPRFPRLHRCGIAPRLRLFLSISPLLGASASEELSSSGADALLAERSLHGRLELQDAIEEPAEPVRATAQRRHQLATQHSLPLLVLAVAGLALLLLTAVFRSLLVPLKADRIESRSRQALGDPLRGIRSSTSPGPLPPAAARRAPVGAQLARTAAGTNAYSRKNRSHTRM